MINHVRIYVWRGKRDERRDERTNGRPKEDQLPSGDNFHSPSYDPTNIVQHVLKFMSTGHPVTVS
jgi:hypothetical protein